MNWLLLSLISNTEHLSRTDGDLEIRHARLHKGTNVCGLTICVLVVFSVPEILFKFQSLSNEKDKYVIKTVLLYYTFVLSLMGLVYKFQLAAFTSPNLKHTFVGKYAISLGQLQ